VNEAAKKLFWWLANSPQRLKPQQKAGHLSQRSKRCATQNHIHPEFFLHSLKTRALPDFVDATLPYWWSSCPPLSL
jgi:hypothetical protein